MSIVKAEIGDKVYEFEFTDWGIRMRPPDGAWQAQGLLFANLVTLIETKNAAFNAHPTDRDAARQAWQKDIIQRLRGALYPLKKAKKVTA